MVAKIATGEVDDARSNPAAKATQKKAGKAKAKTGKI
jgi:hypothetical protein